MDIKDIALRHSREYLTFKLGDRKGLDVAEIVCDDEIYAEIVDELSQQFEAIISAYKAELLKEAGEPVAFMCSDEELCHKGYERFSRHNSGEWNIPIFTSDQVAAAIAKATKPLEDEVKAANSECELFRKNGRIVDANKIVELRQQLAAAQEENGRLENQVLARDAELWGRTQEILGLKDQLAKAEQRVIDACCSVVDERFDECEPWIDSDILRGEWRKFVKEV